MTQRIQATPENTETGEYLQWIYKNNRGVRQGPFYFRIRGKNPNSWKVISVNEFGVNIPTTTITQIQNAGNENRKNKTNIEFGNRKDDSNYISWKYIPFD